MNDKEVSIPQLSFDYKFGEGISTREFLKTVKKWTTTRPSINCFLLDMKDVKTKYYVTLT